MSSNGDYPLGARDDPRAPYNQKELPEREIEVCVSITVHKTYKLKVKDYTIVNEGKDEDGNYFCDVDYGDCHLYDAFVEQYPNFEKDTDWNIDEFEIIRE